VKEGSEATRYVRDGSATLAVVTGGSLKHWTVTLPGGEVIGRVGSGGSSRRYYLKDHLGSIRAVLDGGGGVRETRDYYPFGLPMPGRYERGSPPTEEDFTGHVKDETTGLHYAGARYYSSAFGRWLGPDPILGQKGPKDLLKQDGRLLTMTSYNYAFGNPATLADPTGLAPLDWYRDEEGKIKFDEDVQSQEDLEEGQTYLGESVLVKTKQGGAQLLSEDGEIRNVYEGEASLGEGMALGLSGVGAAAGKSQLTMELAEEASETLIKRNAIAGAILSGSSFAASVTSGNLESWTYRSVKLAADAGLLGLSLSGPQGAIGAFALDLTLKDLVVEEATIQILKRQVETVETVESRVEE